MHNKVSITIFIKLTLGASLSNEITKPLEASASSFKASVFMAAKVSASSSVRPTPEFDLSEDGPDPVSEPLRACLNAEDKVGLVLVGEGEVSFSCTRYVLLPEVMFIWDNRLEAVGVDSSSPSSAEESINDTFCGAISSASGAGTLE